MKKKQITFLQKIVETPSPTGSETKVAELVREHLMPIADEIRTDTMGSVQASYEGSLHHFPYIQQPAYQPDALDDEVPADYADYAEYAEYSDEADYADGEVADYAISEEPYDLDGDYDEVAEEAEEFIEAAYEDQAYDQPGVYDDAASQAGYAAALPPLTLMLSAHMDEVGLMVTYISDDGFLSVSAIGGVDAAILPGMRVDVHTSDGILRGVVGRKPIHLIDADDRKNVTPLDKLVIDLGMPAKKVKKLVHIGDSITYGVGFELFGDDMAVSRAFDDKVGVFITCRVMEKLAKAPDYMGNFVGAITVQEEIGTRGAMTSAHAVMPDVALAFDVTHATDYPGIDKSKHGEIVCGGGPVIARGPNINPIVFERLVAAAKAEGIPYQIEAEPSVTGTDARAIQVTREGIPTGLVSVPLRYMHTPTEVISLDDVEATIKLITRFAMDLDEADDFIPGHAADYASIEKLESEPFDGDYEFLLDEVERISDELADMQLAVELDSDAAFAAGEADMDMPAHSPFARQHNAIASEFAALDLDTKTPDFIPEEELEAAEIVDVDDMDDAEADVISDMDVAVPEGASFVDALGAGAEGLAEDDDEFAPAETGMFDDAEAEYLEEPDSDLEAEALEAIQADIDYDDYEAEPYFEHESWSEDEAWSDDDEAWSDDSATGLEEDVLVEDEVEPEPYFESEPEAATESEPETEAGAEADYGADSEIAAIDESIFSVKIAGAADAAKAKDDIRSEARRQAQAASQAAAAAEAVEASEPTDEGAEPMEAIEDYAEIDAVEDIIEEAAEPVAAEQTELDFDIPMDGESAQEPDYEAELAGDAEAAEEAFDAEMQVEADVADAAEADFEGVDDSTSEPEPEAGIEPEPVSEEAGEPRQQKASKLMQSPVLELELDPEPEPEPEPEPAEEPESEPDEDEAISLLTSAFSVPLSSPSIVVHIDDDYYDDVDEPADEDEDEAVEDVEETEEEVEEDYEDESEDDSDEDDSDESGQDAVTQDLNNGFTQQFNAVDPKIQFDETAFQQAQILAAQQLAQQQLAQQQAALQQAAEKLAQQQAAQRQAAEQLAQQQAAQQQAAEQLAQQRAAQQQAAEQLAQQQAAQQQAAEQIAQQQAAQQAALQQQAAQMAQQQAMQAAQQAAQQQAQQAAYQQSAYQQQAAYPQEAYQQGAYQQGYDPQMQPGMGMNPQQAQMAQQQAQQAAAQQQAQQMANQRGVPIVTVTQTNPQNRY